MKQPDPISEIVQQARAKYEAEDFSQAADLFATAAATCRDAGDLVNAAEMDNNRSVALLQAGDAQGALSAALETDEIFAAAGDLRRQAIALGNQAAAYEELNQFDQAFQRYTESSELLKAAGEKDMRSYVLKRISGLQARRGDQVEAALTMQAALENREKLSLKERALKGLMNKAMDLLGGK